MVGRCGTDEHRVEQTRGGEGKGGDAVGERPEQVALDRPRVRREPDRVDGGEDLAADEAADSPAHRVGKPRRLPSNRRALTADKPTNINLVARNSGNCTVLDALFRSPGA